MQRVAPAHQSAGDAESPEAEEERLARAADSVDDDYADGRGGAAPSRLRLWQFTEQLVSQNLLPLSLPFVALLRGAGPALNEIGASSAPQLTFRFVAELLTLIAVPLLPFVAFAAWFAIAADAEPRLMATLRADFAQVVLCHVCQRLVIALKYGFLRQDVYERRMREFVPRAERRDEQLLGGWLHFERSIVEAEVAAAASGAARVTAEAGKRVDAEQGAWTASPRRSAAQRAPPPAFVVNASSFSRLRSGLCTSAREVLTERATRLNAAGARSVPADALAAALALQAHALTKGFRKIVYLCSLGGSALATVSPTCVRAAFGLPLIGSTAPQMTLVIFHLLSNVAFLGVLFLFVGVAAIDHKRRATSLNLLGRLFLVRADSGDEGDAALTSVLPLASTEAARAFLEARRILLLHGDSFHSRLITTLGCVIIAFAALSAYCVINCWLSPPGDVARIVMNLVMLHCMAAPAMVLSAIGLQVAASANAAAARHPFIVVQARLAMLIEAGSAGSTTDASHKLAIFSSRSLSPGRRSSTEPEVEATAGPAGVGDSDLVATVAARTEMGAVDRLLVGVQQALEAQLDESSVQILGFRASPSLTKSFIGACVSVETAMLSIAVSKLWWSS